MNTHPQPGSNKNTVLPGGLMSVKTLAQSLCKSVLMFYDSVMC